MRRVGRFTGLAGALAIIGAVLLLYGQTFHFPYHFDELPYLQDDASGLSGAKALVRSHAGAGSIWSFNAARFFTFASFALNYRLGGLDPFGYHALNVALHAVNALLVFWLATLFLAARAEASGQEGWTKKENVRLAFPCLAALLFAVHPVQTEAVTYVWQRSTLLVTTFYLLSLILYLRSSLASQGRANIWLAGSAAAAVLAMFTKQIAVTLPLAIVLIDLCFISGSARALKARAGRLAWYLPVLMIVPALTLLGLNREFQDIGSRAENVLPQREYFFTQLNVLVTYLRLLVFPSGQNLDYDYPVAHSILDSLPSLVLLVALFLLALWLFRRIRIASFGILFFFLALSVESSFFPLEDTIFEHRMYLPSMGLFLATAAALFYAAEGRAPQAVVFVCVLVGVAAPLGVATFERNKAWESRESIWLDVVKKSPNKLRGYYHLGFGRLAKGKRSEAARWFSEAARRGPGEPAPHYFLGATAGLMGDLETAEKEYRRAVSLRPSFVPAVVGLGEVYARKGLYKKAAAHYIAVVKTRPRNIAARLGLARALERLGRNEAAVREYFNILKLRPAHPEANHRIGLYYRRAGRRHKAAYHLALARKGGAETAGPTE